MCEAAQLPITNLSARTFPGVGEQLDIRFGGHIQPAPGRGCRCYNRAKFPATIARDAQSVRERRTSRLGKAFLTKVYTIQSQAACSTKMGVATIHAQQ